MRYNFCLYFNVQIFCSILCFVTVIDHFIFLSVVNSTNKSLKSEVKLTRKNGLLFCNSFASRAYPKYLSGKIHFPSMGATVLLLNIYFPCIQKTVSGSACK